MSLPELSLANGYYRLPPGKLANLVTCLEMRAKPELKPLKESPELELTRFRASDIARYRALFRQIGENLLWFSRLIMPDEKLLSTLNNEQVFSYLVSHNNEPIGLLELDFTEPQACELAFFGLLPEKIGKAYGSALMSQAITMAWSQPIQRLWVHTCHYDHPSALPFYQKHGFEIYELRLEVHDDPRLCGHLSLDMARHVPLLTPREKT